MTHHSPPFALRFARTDAEVAAAQALRYHVFVAELGGKGGELTNVERELETDCFDKHCEHLFVFDSLQGSKVIGTTRIMTEEGAALAGQFASEAEFDLSGLRRSKRRLMEVGRTCLHRDHRGGVVMHRLWQGLAAYVEERAIELLFGLASFPGTQPAGIAQSLSCLQRDHLAPDEVRPRSLKPISQEIIPQAQIDRREAMLNMPALVKAYLRLGGKVGEGAFLDTAFGCIDVCMVIDTAMFSNRAKAIYRREGR